MIGEGATDEVIRKFLLTYCATPQLMLNAESPAELPMGRTVRTISQALIPKNKTDKPAKGHKRGVFLIGDILISRDFRVRHPWTAETVVKQQGKSSVKYR